MRPAVEIIVRAGPYSDGSGYQAEANVERDDADGPVVNIEINYRIDAKAWVVLRDGIDAAIALIESREPAP